MEKKGVWGALRVGGGTGPFLSGESQVETTGFLGKPAGRFPRAVILIQGHLATGQNGKGIAKGSSSNQVVVGWVGVQILQ